MISGGRLLIVSHVRVRRYGGGLYLHGGFGRHVDSMARHFEQIVLLTCSQEVQTLPDDYRLQSSNVVIVGVPPLVRGNRPRRYISMGRAALMAAVRLPRAIRSCDVIHPRLPSAVGAVGALMTRFSSKPVFVYMAGDWEAALRSRGMSLHNRALATMVQRSLQFLTGDNLCFTAGEEVARKFGGPSSRVIPVMTTAIDHSHLVTVENARARALRPPREILFTGAVWKMKGVHILLDALALLRRRGIDARLRIIGSTPDGGGWLAQQIERTDLSKAVVHVPHMDWERLITEYDHSDVFVLPSLAGRGEGVPKVVLEAMARGLPVVASDVGGVATLVRHEQNGLLVPPGSAEGIAEAVSRLWSDSALRQRLGGAAVGAAAAYDLHSLIDGMIGTVRGLPLAPN